MDRISNKTPLSTATLAGMPPAATQPGAGAASPSVEDIREEARQGLYESEKIHGQFWKLDVVRGDKADESLARLEEMGRAAHEAGTVQAARVSRLAAQFAHNDPKVRLDILQQGLSAIEAGAASSVGFMASLAVRFYETLEDSEYTREDLPQAPAGLLESVASQAAADGLPDAGFATLLQHMAEKGLPPLAALQAAARPSPSGVSGQAATAASLLDEAVTADRASIVEVALKDLEGLASRDSDARAQAHLARLHAWQGLGLSDGSKQAAARGVLDALAKGSDAGVQGGLGLAARVLQGKDTPQNDLKILGDAAMHEARAASLPSAAPWLAFHDRVAPVLTGDAQAGNLKREVVKALAESRPLDLPAMARAAAAVSTATRNDAAGATVLAALVADLEALDASAGGTHAAFFQRLHSVQGRLAPGQDGARHAILREAIGTLVEEGQPSDGAGKAVPVGSGASIPDLAALARKAAQLAYSKGDARQVAAAFLADIASLASADRPALAAWAQALSNAVLYPQAEEKYTTAVVNEALDQFARPPEKTAEFAAAAERLINKAGYHLDRLHLAGALSQGLSAVATALQDAEAAPRVGLLARLAQREMYDVKGQTAAFLSGLGALAKPGNAKGNAMAAFAWQVSRSAATDADKCAVLQDALAELEVTSSAEPDMADCARMLRRVASCPTASEESRAAACLSGLEVLAKSPLTDPLLATATVILGTKASSGLKIEAAQATASSLLDRAKRKSLLDIEAQAAFLRDAARMPFSSQDVQADVLAKGIARLQKGTAAGEQGLAQMVQAMGEGTKYALDQVHLVQKVLDATGTLLEKTNEQERLAFLRTLQRIVLLENYEDRYRLGVAREAMKPLAARVNPDPGELAAAGLSMINGAYYYNSMLQIGNLVLEGMEALAAAEKDTVYTPVLVAEARKAIAAAGKPDAQVETLRASLKDLSKLRGDEFRKALINALQSQNPEDQKKVEQNDDSVVIGGLKIPRKKGATQ